MKRFLTTIQFIVGLLGGYAAMDYVTGDGDVVYAAMDFVSGDRDVARTSIGDFHSDASIDRILAESPGGAVYIAVRTYFPEEAAVWRNEMRALPTKSAEHDLQFDAFEIGSRIRRRLAPAVAFAPDDLLVAVIEEQIRMVAAYNHDPDACNRILLQGPAGLNDEESQRLLPVLDNAGISYKAMYAGKTEPVKRHQSTGEDWEILFDALSLTGFTQEDLALVIEPDMNDGRLCAAMIDFITFVAHAEFDGADRIRAELAVAMLET